MSLLTIEHINKGYADRVILQDVSLTISEGEKIGVIGVNGTGKSTLLKIIANLEQPDSGQIIRMRGLRIEYLPQQPEFPEGADVMQAVLHGYSPVMGLIREYERAAADLDENPDDLATQHRLIALSARMDAAEAWNLDSEAKSILTRLGIQDFRQPVADMSGGQKKRVALAGALLNPADLLILDEPTNHIDPTSVDWLEQYLANYRGALLMVTHDRYFLERVTKVMLEIDQAQVYRYEANYDQWLELKADRVAREAASEQKRQNILRQELAWIRRGAKARSTKQKARIDRFNTLTDTDSPQEEQQVAMSAAETRLGRKTLILERISKGWSNRCLFSEFSYIVSRHERLGLIGPNGCGKTTLLNILAGRLEPDSGHREVGSTVNLGYFTQEDEKVDPDLRVIEYIRQTAEIVETDDGTLSASQMLERFLFPPALQWTQVRKLSGGERRRLFLLKILMGAPNILLLDEPTNDLDILTLSILEDYLESFPGAVIVVSHDRYFLDRVVGRILSFEPDGKIHQYEGNYEAWQQQLSNQSAVVEENRLPVMNNSKKDTERKGSANTIIQPKAKLRLKMSEKIEYETINARVADLEARISHLRTELAAAASDYVRLQELTGQMERLTVEYDEAMNRWLYLTDLVEEIEAQSSNNG